MSFNTGKANKETNLLDLNKDWPNYADVYKRRHVTHIQADNDQGFTRKLQLKDL